MMNTTETAQQRFMRVAYPRTLAAAKRAFSGWHWRKREDAIQECLAKMWDQWIRLVERGKDPEPMLGGLLKFALLWVRYDRRIAGRGSHPDVYDYRSGFRQQRLSSQGYASPTERSDPGNGWIDWVQRSGDDPAELAAALEAVGVSLEEYTAA